MSSAGEELAARHERALALARSGRLPEAMAEVRLALGLEPRHVPALWLLAQLKTFGAGDPDLATLEALAAEPQGLEERDLIRLRFTLAKALEDTGEHRRSFEQLRRANALRRATFDYDVDTDIRAMDRIEAVFDVPLIERLAGGGAESDRPILIVGMPRSGSSLVEQILASHPAVYGAGERDDLAQMVASITLLSGGRGAFPEGVGHLRGNDLASLGHGYDRRLEALAPGALRVADKNVFSFAYLGLVRLILPRARIIHCVRDPVDTCLSCFKTEFEKVRFAFDLGELGRFYAAYARLMDHWRRVLPCDWILEVRYEELVEGVEAQARRMLDHCGLEWDDRCLAFQSTDRVVRTASFAQVRQPVYARSVGRWRDYEPYLGALLSALEP